MLTCFTQALLVLVWFRTKGDVEVVGTGCGVSRATAYRYRDKGLKVLAERDPDLHEALHEVAEQGWPHVVLDGTVVRSDRCTETTTSVKDENDPGTAGSTAHPTPAGRPAPRRPADLGVRGRAPPPPARYLS